MSEAFLIMLREGFEAVLVVAIVFTYLRTIGRRDLFPSAWTGVAAGVVLATAIGLVVHWTVGDLSGRSRLVAFAVISIAAAVVLTWMIFWMRRQGGAMKGELEHRVDDAITSGTAGRGVMLVAFTAVLREGIEAALFLIAAAVGTSSTDVFVGGMIGVIVAAALGYFIYVGGRRVPVRAFFSITGVLLILFAGGLCAKAVFYLQAAGDLGTVNDALYDVTGAGWLTINTESGRFLAGIFGWDPRPSAEQVLAWLLYVVPVMFFFLREVVTPRRAPAKAVTSG
jgi:high-affinity iron transporter